MKKYETLPHKFATAEKGDIITILRDEYIDFSGGKWKEHFYKKKIYLLVTSGESNNGNAKAIDCHGKMYHVHHSQMIEIKRSA